MNDSGMTAFFIITLLLLIVIYYLMRKISRIRQSQSQTERKANQSQSHGCEKQHKK